jgi:hypothetical protein
MLVARLHLPLLFAVALYITPLLSPSPSFVGQCIGARDAPTSRASLYAKIFGKISVSAVAR